MSSTSSQEPVVLVVDDDASMRASLRRLLTVARIGVEVYASGTEFLAEAKLDRPGCVLLDVGMPAMSGLEVQARLNQRGVSLPVIFLTGSADIPIAVAAMREGAVDFVEKPFENDDLLARVRRAIAHHHRHRKIEEDRQIVLQRLATLTPREREVLELVVAGNTNKEIARVLGASHRTIEIHRVHLMEKMTASTLADLVRMRLLVGDNTTMPEGRGGERVDAR
jgi:RNA polymerase sigma factor (sigma-70 family)